MRVVILDHLVKELECLKCTWALSLPIWTPALALTDKSEWRLTTVTCSTVTSYLGERSAASSDGEASQPQIHINAHYGCWCKNVCSVLVAIRKTRSKPETQTPHDVIRGRKPFEFSTGGRCWKDERRRLRRSSGSPDPPQFESRDVARRTVE